MSKEGAKKWVVLDVQPGLRVSVVSERPPLAPEVDARVERAWRQACAETPALFNGSVFSVDHADSTSARGHWTEYRRVLAQLRIPGLAAELRLRPLAVAGLIEGPDGIIFGRRPERAVYQPGLWQLAPAGNVDPTAATPDGVDVFAALVTELREELGLAPESVKAPRPVCMVQHPGIGVLDLCVALRTDLGEQAIRAAHARGGDGEYPEIALVPRAKLGAFLDRLGVAVAPQVALFLERYARLAD